MNSEDLIAAEHEARDAEAENSGEGVRTNDEPDITSNDGIESDQDGPDDNEAAASEDAQTSSGSEWEFLTREGLLALAQDSE